MYEQDEITLTSAAQKLTISYERARRLVCIGTIAGRQIPGTNRWVVTKESVDRECERRAAASVTATV